MKKGAIFIDFDSTISSFEMLDRLALIVSKRYMLPSLVNKISEITHNTMNGTLNYAEALNQRLSYIAFGKTELQILINEVIKSIDPEFESFCDEVLDNWDLYIVSGGFKQVILPALSSYKVKSENIYANSLVFNADGENKGYDKHNLLSQENGKSVIIKNIRTDGIKVMVGDGYTDALVKLTGAANIFIAFTKYVKRQKIVENADYITNNFYEIIQILNFLSRKK